MTNDNVIKAMAVKYLFANPEHGASTFSEAGEDLMEATLKHPDVARMLERIGVYADSPAWCRIERNRRMGTGKGLRVEIGMPICCNHHYPDGDTQLGLMAEVEIEICAPDHPHYPGEVWHVQVSMSTWDMDDWPVFEHFEAVLPEPELPEPIFIKKAT